MQRCPPEVLREIVSHLRPRGYRKQRDTDRHQWPPDEGLEALRATALLCRRTAPVSQERIFSHIHMENQSLCEPLLDTFDSRPHLADYVRDVQMGFALWSNERDWFRVGDPRSLKLVAHFASITSLHLTGAHFHEVSQTYILALFTSFKQLHDLKITACTFRDPSDLSVALEACESSLRTVHITQCDPVAIHPTPTHHVPTPRMDGTVTKATFPQLAALSLNDAELSLVYMLAWFLHGGVANGASSHLTAKRCAAVKYIDLRISECRWPFPANSPSTPAGAWAQDVNLDHLGYLTTLTIHVAVACVREWAPFLLALVTLPDGNVLEDMQIEGFDTHLPTLVPLWGYAMSALDSTLEQGRFARLRRLFVNVPIDAGETFMPRARQRGILSVGRSLAECEHEYPW